MIALTGWNGEMEKGLGFDIRIWRALLYKSCQGQGHQDQNLQRRAMHPQVSTQLVHRGD